MTIPLKNRLKRQAQVRLAELQDEAVDIVYRVLPNAVLHGGTAIWRCFSGNRFSEDLDFYALAGKNFREELEAELRKRSLILSKFKQTENVIFAKISNQQTEVSLEIAVRKSPKTVSTAYERTDGSFVEIFSLSPEDFLAEKASAYQNRRLVRDLYDVFFLLDKSDSIEKAKKELEKLVHEFKPPKDEKNLKILVYSGIAPSVNSMLERIRKRLSK
ncbi:MAG: nucleotidyl transferase AbiEii/AbiGii toxin family protein [Candidatus Micrarchaeota archaeon]